MKLFDWFFGTPAGHWVLNTMTLRQFLAFSLFAFLIILSIGKVLLDALKMVNWRLLGDRMKNLRLPGKALSWK